MAGLTTNATILTTVSPNFNITRNYADYIAFRAAIMTTTSAIYSLIAAFIIATCVSLFVVLLSSPSLRSGLRNLLVLSLMVTYLLVGLVGAPFVADYSVHGRWRHGCFMSMLFGLLTVFFQNFVTMWTVVLLVLHYVARVQRYEGPTWLVRLPARLQRALPGLIVALPWALAMVINIPVVFTGLGRMRKYWRDDNCPFVMTRKSAIVLSVLTFYLPAIALIALGISAVVLYQRRGKADGQVSGASRAEMGASLVTKADDDLEPPLVFALTAGVTVVFMAPDYIFSTAAVYFVVPMAWKTRAVLFWVFTSFNDCLPFVHAIMWMLLFRDVRQRLLELLAILPCRSACCKSRLPPQSSGSTSVPPVIFKDLRDD